MDCILLFKEAMMEELDLIILRKDCLCLAVDSGADYSEAITIASFFYDFIVEGSVPGAIVIPFPRPVPQTPNT